MYKIRCYLSASKWVYVEKLYGSGEHLSFDKLEEAKEWISNQNLNYRNRYSVEGPINE